MAFDPLSVPIPEETLDEMYASCTRIVLMARKAAAEHYDHWRMFTDDDTAEYLTGLLYEQIPVGRDLWEMLAEYPSLGKMPPSDGTRIDGGIEGDVRDAFYDACWFPLWQWASDVWETDPETPND